MSDYELIIIGGGAAGMMAAISAAENNIPGKKILVLERNEKLGKKIYITGKGRCNLTNACDIEELFDNIPRQSSFLYSAFYTFTNQQVIDFFEESGMKTKVERGKRVFPASDHSSDVINTLKRRMEQNHICIQYHAKVDELIYDHEKLCGVRLCNGRCFYSPRVLIATGGMSYESTGSTGDGYRLAKEAGHRVSDLSPSLVPLTTAEEDVLQLQGLAPKNVSIKITDGKKCIYENFGEMLFTHFGVSGPLILSASAVINDRLREKPLTLLLDWKPALTIEQLDRRILGEFEENKNRQFKNILSSLAPAKLIPVLIARSGIPEDKKVNEITREERKQLTLLFKQFSVTLTGLRGFREAIITRGGVVLKEVNPSTMESKLVSGLYFAGEVLDLDAYTGGFNLQIAWSTGHLAGYSAAEDYKLLHT